MLVLIKNEIIKLMFRKKTLVVLIGFILLTGLMAFGAYKNEQSMKRFESTEYRIESLERSIQYMKKDLERFEKDPKISSGDKKELLDRITSTEEQVKLLKENPAQQTDWREELKISIANQENHLKMMENQHYAYKETAKLELEKLKYLQQKDIEPIKGYEFKAYNFMTTLIEWLGMIFLAVGVVVFVSDIVSGECTPATLKFLLTQPVSRGKVLASKFVAVSITAAVLIVLVEVAYFLGIGAIFGFGNSQYPMSVGSLYEYDLSTVMDNGRNPIVLIAGSARFIPVGQYVLRLLLLQGLFIVVCTAFAFLVSTLLKSSMVAMAVSIVSIIASIVVFQAINGLKRYAVYLFTSYGEVGNILTGSIVHRFDNPNITSSFIIVILIAWTIVCYVISHVVFVKKDILI